MITETAQRFLRTLYKCSPCTRDVMIRTLGVAINEFENTFEFLYEQHYIFLIKTDTFQISPTGRAYIENIGLG